MGNTKTTTDKKRSETPLMQQYYAIKAKHPGALLLFRVGDFYETFSEDAIRASKILGIVLTQRKNGTASTIELAGFPYHSLDVYLPKLVRAGERVAICEQLEDPKKTKSIVKRGVTEMVTPGVSFSDQILDSSKNNFLASVHFGTNVTGAAFVDISTGEFFAAQGSKEYIEKLVSGFAPSEIIFERSKKQLYQETFGNKYHTYHLEDWAFQHPFAEETLTRQFGTHSLKGFGIKDLTESVIAGGAAIHYLSETQIDRLKHISTISRIDANEHVWLDKFTQRNLELFSSSNENGKSLLQILDSTSTPMGSRMLKSWLAFPMINITSINDRFNVVDQFISNVEKHDKTKEQLQRIGDLERMTARLSIGKLGPREALQLSRSLDESKKLSSIEIHSTSHTDLNKSIHHCIQSIELINQTINEDAPAVISKGNFIAEGVNQELDELRSIAFSGKDYLLQLQERESKKTGITSLKIGFNNVFGYYLEVTHAHKDKVPDAWVRKQTLVNAERYITEELKQYEEKILGAEEKIAAIEQQLYYQLLDRLQPFIPHIQSVAKSIGEIDCLSAFATNAINYQYKRPVVDDSHEIEIISGRHPVIEREMVIGEPYIPNDISLNRDDQQIIMITGPNMSGKSAILRQCALISLMAQIGSFVPVERARLGIIDKLFTRVGASDNISQGESTFMVEMNETASILNNLSPRSLILLDEIGRGTSTYDGISIAWSIAEYLHENQNRPLTLFATHYHELNEMEAMFSRIKNFTISIRETKDKIIFLRKLIAGGSEHSFGIQVAKMAGMPNSLIKRAGEILFELEKSERTELSKTSVRALKEDIQLSFFQLDDPVLSQIRDELINLDINSLTPVEALFKLNEVKKLLGKKA